MAAILKKTQFFIRDDGSDTLHFTARIQFNRISTTVYTECMEGQTKMPKLISKQQQRGFEPGLYRLRDRNSTAELTPLKKLSAIEVIDNVPM